MSSIAIVQGLGGGQGQAILKKLFNTTNLKVIGLTSNINKTLDKLNTNKDVEKSSIDRRLELHQIDLSNPSNYDQVSQKIIKDHGQQSAKLILNISGILNPEKSVNQIDFKLFEKIMRINFFGTVLAAKYFLPLFPRQSNTENTETNLPEFSVFASWSARIGSIDDNKLGGWYSYRSSKAALNMFVKTFAKELNYQKYNAIAINYHPGTVKTKLSEPYINNTDRKVHSVDQAANNLFKTLSGLRKEDNGKFIAYDGSQIPY